MKKYILHSTLFLGIFIMAVLCVALLFRKEFALFLFFLLSEGLLVLFYVSYTKQLMRQKTVIEKGVADCNNCSYRMLSMTVSPNQQERKNAPLRTGMATVENDAGKQFINPEQLHIKIREYAFDSMYEKNVFFALIRNLKDDFHVDFHCHLNEIFTIINTDISYYNDLWTTHMDFVVRYSHSLDDVVGCVEVAYYESNYNNERVMKLNQWKEDLCRQNRIPFVRISRQEALALKVYDETTYPASLICFFHELKSKV